MPLLNICTRGESYTCSLACRHCQSKAIRTGCCLTKHGLLWLPHKVTVGGEREAVPGTVARVYQGTVLSINHSFGSEKQPLPVAQVSISGTRHYTGKRRSRLHHIFPPCWMGNQISSPTGVIAAYGSFGYHFSSVGFVAGMATGHKI